jgi:hypothetical protein
MAGAASPARTGKPKTGSPEAIYQKRRQVYQNSAISQRAF